jgi:hypothetical protein
LTQSRVRNLACSRVESFDDAHYDSFKTESRFVEQCAILGPGPFLSTHYRKHDDR